MRRVVSVRWENTPSSDGGCSGACGGGSCRTSSGGEGSVGLSSIMRGACVGRECDYALKRRNLDFKGPNI